jgi:hypothetical protein
VPSDPLRDYRPDRFDLYGDLKRHSPVQPWLVAIGMIVSLGCVLAGIFPIFFALVLLALVITAEAY